MSGAHLKPISNSPSVEELHEWDRLHNLKPWSMMNTWREEDGQIIDRGDGIYMWDSHGRRMIDGPGGMWCVQIGHGRHEMADAIADQVMKLAYSSPFSTGTEPAAILARKLAEFAPGDLNTVFFTTGGSTAVDTALRAMHFLNNRRGMPDKKVVISRERAYHGSTYLSATVSGKERNRTRFDKENRLVHFLPDVDPYRRPEGMSIETFCDQKVDDLEQAILELGPENVGAFIAEPILCSGGVIVPPPGYHKRTLEICRKHDVLYISDEVVTGFGRLGHWFASEPVFDVVPDMITCAKGLTSGYLPLGACIISDRIMEQMTGPEEVLFSNGYTYSAHPVSCAAALKNIEIMEREDILGHVREVTPYFQERLRSFEKFPIVGDLRGMGLLGCIEGKVTEGRSSLAQDSDFGTRLDTICEENGLLLRPLINMAVFSPPLIISKPQIDTMFDIIEGALEQVSREMGIDG